MTQEKAMTYKAGDLVTLKLRNDQAERLNVGSGLYGFADDQIVKHEPAPEPIVGYIVKYGAEGFGTTLHRSYDSAEKNTPFSDDCLIIKVSYNAADGTATAQVAVND